MSKSYWVRKSLASRVGYMLGVSAQKYTYPTANFIVTSGIDKDLICKIARHLDLKVRLHKGEWQEQNRNISDIINSKDYGQEKEIKD